MSAALDLDLLALILNVATFIVQMFRGNFILMHVLFKLRLLKPISYFTLDWIFAGYNRESDYFVVKGKLPSKRNIDRSRYPEVDVYGGGNAFQITHRGQSYLLDWRQKVLYHYASKARTILVYKTLLYDKHNILMPTWMSDDFLDDIVFNTEKFDVYPKVDCTLLPLLDYEENRLWAMNVSILSLLSDPLGLTGLKLALAGLAFGFEWFRPISSIAYDKSFDYAASKVKYCASFICKSRKILDLLSNFSNRFRVCDRETGLIIVLKKGTIMCSAVGCMEYLEAVDREALIDQEYFDFKATVEGVLRGQRRDQVIRVQDVEIRPKLANARGISFYMHDRVWLCNPLLMGSEGDEDWIKCAYILAKGMAFKLKVRFGSSSGHLNDTAITSPTFQRLKKDCAIAGKFPLSFPLHGQSQN